MEQTTAEMTEQRRKFVELREKGNLEQWATKEKLASPEAALIRAVLNIYELVAIGIDKHTLDKKIYRNWYRTSLVKDWITLKNFVRVYQMEHNPKLFCNYEDLARRWANENERKHV